MQGLISWISDNSGFIYLVLVVVVLPFLKQVSDTYIDNKALAAILRGLTGGAEIAVKALGEGKTLNRETAQQIAISYAREKFPDAFARLKPDDATVQDMATTVLEPTIRAAVTAQALDAVARASPSLTGAAAPLAASLAASVAPAAGVEAVR